MVHLSVDSHPSKYNEACCVLMFAENKLTRNDDGNCSFGEMCALVYTKRSGSDPTGS